MSKHQPIISRRASAYRKRPAFTLIELTVALAISGLLLVAIGGAVTIASQAMPDRSDSSHEHSEAAEVARAIAADIRYASVFSELTTDAITFTVADRDGDGQDDTIRYECLGTADVPASLTRSINGGSAITLLDDVRGFNFDFGTYEITEPGPLVLGESDERLLIDEGDTSGTSNFTIFVDDSVGERFKLAPNDANHSWRITRAKLMIANQGNSDGVLSIQLRTVNGNGLPTAEVLDQVSFLESNGSTSVLSEVSFSGDVELSPETDYCIVVVYESGTSAVGKVAVRNISSNTPNTALLEATFGEAKWQERTTGDMVLQVFGHVSGYISSPATVSKTRLRWVGMTIEPAEDEQTHATVQTQVFAQPEVVP